MELITVLIDLHYNKSFLPFWLLLMQCPDRIEDLSAVLGTRTDPTDEMKSSVET